jgi:hypothetical protein
VEGWNAIKGMESVREDAWSGNKERDGGARPRKDLNECWGWNEDRKDGADGAAGAAGVHDTGQTALISHFAVRCAPLSLCTQYAGSVELVWS